MVLRLMLSPSVCRAMMICVKLSLLITGLKEPSTMVKLDYFFEAVVSVSLPIVSQTIFQLIQISKKILVSIP